jgi:DNA (cytosine-5)-methyltransferase 1
MVPYTLKICSDCEGGGKGALIQEDKSATLATNNDQYLFQPVAFAANQRDEVRDLGDKAGALQAQPGMKQQTFIIDNVGGQAEYAKASSVNGTLRAGAQGLVAYAVENHPADSRVNIDDSGKVQTLTSRMGTGGGNVPMVMEEKPVICLQGNGIDRADTAGCDGKGWKEDTCYTLNTIDRPAVAYGLDRASFNQGQNAKFDFSVTEEQQPTLTAKGPGAVAHCTDVGWLSTCEDQSPTLLARQYKDPHLVSYSSATDYIVRRLTPTECARLQGFADWWGVVEQKDTLTDEEYHFWLEVRNTHARINGKTEQDYTAKQMLTWYNKLWTDSAEYKMWGNGIALPTALYCIQGIAEVLARPIEEDPDDWMN